MTNLKKLLALVLVVAMTVTMLPVFAAAEDVAVETVMPAAEVPAAEAAPAVEDVSFIPELPQAQAPAAAPVEAIETVAAEAAEPVAELQAIVLTNGVTTYESDDAALADGYFLRIQTHASSLNGTVSATAYYNTFAAAATDATASRESFPVITLLCDYTYVDSATTGILIDLNASTVNSTNTALDLGGHTLTVKSGRTVISRSGGYLNGVTIRNGTIIYQNAGRTGTTGGIVYCQGNATTSSGGTQTLNVNVIDANLFSLACGGGDPQAIIGCSPWFLTLNLTNSKLIAQDGPAVRHLLATTVTSSSTASTQTSAAGKVKNAACTVNMTGACVFGTLQEGGAAIQYRYPASTTKPANATSGGKLKVVVNTDENNLSTILGASFAEIINDPGNTDRFELVTPANYNTTSTYSLALPDATTFYTESSYASDVQPGWLEPADFASIIPPLNCTHATLDHHEAFAATWNATGNIEYWQCTNCLKLFSDSAAATEVSEDDITLPKVKDDAGAVADGMVMRWDKPDGSWAYYADPRTAFSDASAATVTGGKLYLLRDYTYVDDGSIDASSAWFSYSNYNNYTTTEDGITVRGFWVDLGGHTLTAKVGRAMIGRGGVANVNVKNGTMIYQNNGRAGVLTGMFLAGVTSTGPYTATSGILVNRITLKDVNAYSIPKAKGGACSVFVSSLCANEFRLYNSKAIATEYTGLKVQETTAGITGGAVDAFAAVGGPWIRLELHDGSVFGTTSENSAIYTTKTSAPTDGLTRTVTITDDGTGNYLLGSVVLGKGTFTPVLDLPDGCDADPTTYSLAIPDRTTIASEETLDAAPTYLEAADCSAFHFVAHVHTEKAAHHEATAATYTAEGNTEYWACTCGKFFSDAACETEIAENSWVIPMLACSHPEPEAHPAVAPTFAAAGSSAYWYCPTCERYFSEAACENEIEENSWVIAELEPAAATGKTDAELIALGAYFKTTAPDGTTVKAFTDIRSAYADANSWTEAGGELLLLTDYELVYSTANTSGYIQTLPGSDPEVAPYDNNEEADMPVKGFWFDLGGHTLTTRLGQALYYGVESVSVNIKHGKLVHQNIGRDGSSYWGVITFGTSKTSPTGSGVIRCPQVNLKDVEIYSLAPAAGKDETSVIASTIWNTTVNIKDSTLVSASHPALKFKRSLYTPTAAMQALLEVDGSNYNVNVSGASTIGSTVSSAINTSPNGAAEGIAHHLNVTASENTVFFGTVLHGNSAAVPATASGLDGFVDTVRSYTFPEISETATDCKTWVYPAVYVATDLAGQQTEESSAKATLTYGASTAYFAEVNDALAAAEKLGAKMTATVTLNAAATETYTLGAQGATSAFTLDLNGQALPAEGLFDPSAAAGKTVTVTMASAGEGKVFKGVPEKAFTANDSFVVEKGSVFTDYSLNLEDSVTINLYTVDDASVSVAYVQDGKENVIAEKDDAGAWVVSTLAAKQMAEPIDAYAAKTEDATTYIDFSKGISVQSYAKRDDVKAGVSGDELAALTETLDAMQVYGAYAAKYFANDGDELTDIELNELIGKPAAPSTYTENLRNDTFDFSNIEKCTKPGDSGYYGSTAKLGDRLSLKFYFYGEAYEGAASVTVGETAREYKTGTDKNGNYHCVEVAVAAKEFDTAITVAFENAESVTDSLSAYTDRVIQSDSPENVKAHNLAQALRAYGAAAKAYDAAKAGT